MNKEDWQSQDCLRGRSPRQGGGLAQETQCSAELLPQTAGTPRRGYEIFLGFTFWVLNKDIPNKIAGAIVGSQ